MKTNNIILLAAAALLFVNCAREEIDVTFKTGTAVAVMETEDTKSDVTDEGYFTWATGDKITIHTNKGNLPGTLNDGAETPNGTFTYSYVDGQEPTGYAMYPYSESHSVNDGVVTFHMPASYDLGETMSNTNAPMLAKPSVEKNSATATYNFSHLGGVIRVVFKNAPAGTDKFTLSLGGSKINGEFEVDLAASVPQIATATTESETENLTTLTFDALETVQNITLFVPVPTGNYTGIEAKLFAGDQELGKWGSETATNNIGRRALVLMAPITFSNAGGNIENDQQVSSPDELAAAVANGGTVTVTEGITLDEEVVIPEGKEVVLNLNGNTINSASSIKVSEGATLSLVNNGQSVQVKSGASVSCGIVGEKDIIVASKDATINIGEDVSLYSTENCAVFIPSGAEGVTLNTAGDLSAGGTYSALYVNGNVKTGTINILGGSISHDTDVAVYIAGNSDVTVSEDVKITGTTAMEVRAGKLTVNGGEFVATAKPNEYTPNGNGSTSKGVALAMCKHSTTENSLVVEINGGEFTGAKSLLVNTDLGPVSLTVNGGTFSDPTPCYYLGNTANVTVNMTEDYTGPGFVVKSGQEVALGMDENTTYTVTAPLVGSPGTQTLGFQFLQDATVNIRGGKITSSAAKMLIQNYAKLTLEDVMLAPTVENLDQMKTASGKVQTYYVLSNNCGEVVICGNTTIQAPVLDGLTAYAFDVCKYSTYEEPIVIWASSGKVEGDIELSGGHFTVKESLDLTGVIKVTGNSNVNLHSGTITSGGDVFDVDGGTLTVEGNDDTKVIAESGVGSTCAVWVHNNGTAIINGGHYSVGADKNGLRNDCIYAGSKSEQSTGTIIINGGKFEYTGEKSDENAKDGDLFLINRYDMTPESHITVNGGSFKNHVPGYESTEPDRASAVTLGEGKMVFKTEGEEEVEVTTAHTGDTDVWYTVK